jgi:CHAD domain-containing protein
MDIELDSAQRPLRRLRKALKRLPSDPTPADVHDLRTQSRKLEAVAGALQLDRKKTTRQVLKTVTPVRKAAGNVRDMDVFVGHLFSLSRKRDDDSLVRLMEHLGERRMENARELHRTVEENRKHARRSLKDYSKLIGKQFPGKKQVMASPAPAPAALATELANWPKLDEENIHSFRIKVKQLRYMLQLSDQADKKIVEALGKVKDEVGDWHDWQELAAIARQVLNPREDRTALKRIEEIGAAKLKKALAAANELRVRYFSRGVAHARSHSNARKSKPGR